jgi:hypothetical protein
MKRYSWLALILVLASCGRNSALQPAVSGQNTPSTATIDTTETSVFQTMVAEGATADAEQSAYEQMEADQTATALVDPRPTAGPGTWPTLEPYTPQPQPTREFRLFTQRECDPSGGEEGGADFVRNCWHGLVNGHDLFVEAGGTRAVVGPARQGFLRITEGRDEVLYRYPTREGTLLITAVQLPHIVVSVGDTLTAMFNLETRQWLNPQGTPIATATP